MSRAYTVSEIDRMRNAVEHIWLFNCKVKDRPRRNMISRTYKEDEKVKCIEELLRTYILAGISPDELEGGEAP